MTYSVIEISYYSSLDVQ